MASLPAPVERWEGHPHIADQILVKFTPETTAEDRSALMDASGSVVKEYWNELRMALVDLPDVPEGGDNVIPMAQWFHSQPAVEYAEPDFDLSAYTQTPNDPLFNGMWGLANTGQVGVADLFNPVPVAGVAGADIDATLAWDVSTGSNETVVAIIDGGVDYFHPDLRANMWRNPGERYDGVDNDRNGYVDDVYGYDFADRDSDPMDEDGHGTHVAGTVAAVGNNGLGVTGVSWNTKIMALKVFGATGGASAFIAAIRYTGFMRQNFGVNVVASNNSWGIYNYAPTLSTSFYDAIRYASDAGVSFVAASGNDTLNLDNVNLFDTPSELGIGGVISVASSNRADELSDFSNWGPATVDLAAPGTDILSTWPTALRADCLASTQSLPPINGYCAISGTSMASPMVTGAVAVLRSLSPALTPEETKNILNSSVDKVPAFEERLISEGRMNLYKAVLALPHIEVSGSVFNDLNGDKVRETNEGPLAGFRVYADLNDNGLYNVGEPTDLTDALGLYTVNVYAGAGTYKLRVVAPTGWRQTTPGGDGSFTFTAVNGQRLSAVFGLRELPGGISGRKYNDLDGNGAADPGEVGVGGIQIYADLDNDGRPGFSEPRTTTAADGTYSLGNLAPGTYVIREIGIPGWIPSVIDPVEGPGAISGVVVASGAITADVDFFNTEAIDYGDAPLPYAVTLAEGGPFAPVLAGFHLGLTIDGEVDGVHSPAGLADADDITGTADEDGLVFSSIFPGQAVSATVTVRTGGAAPGYLQLWIDYNGDGTFAESERVVRNLQIGTIDNYALPNIIAPLNVNTVDPIYARARYGYELNLLPTGGSAAGEVEDYRLQVLSNVPIARNDPSPPLTEYVARVGSLFAANPLNVLANDSGSFLGGPILVAAGLPAGGATTLGGQVRINNNNTPANPADDFLEYQAPTSVTAGALIDTFQYRVSDGTNLSNAATVRIRLLPREVVAVDNTFTFTNAAPLTHTLNVLANDISFATMQITQVTPIGTNTLGTVAVSGDGLSLVFTSNSTTGLAQFVYTVTDDLTDPTRSKTAKVTIQVNSAATLPDGTTTRPGVQADLQVIPTDDAGNPLDEVVPGQSFWVTVYTRDPRVAAAFPGVKAAYVDLLYDRTLFTPTDAVTANGNYVVNHNDFGIPGDPTQVEVYNVLKEPFGDAVDANNILGVVNDAGGFYEISSDPNSPTAQRYPTLEGYTQVPPFVAKYPLYRFHLTANAGITGSQVTSFVLDPADQPTANPNSVLVISTVTGNPAKLTPQEVNFIAYSNFVVRGPVPLAGNPEGEYTNIALPADVNRDRSVDAADVLAVIYEYNNAKGTSEIWKLQPGMFGRTTPLIGYIDVNGDGELAADDILHVIYKMYSKRGQGEGESLSTTEDSYAANVDSLFTDEEE